MKRKEQKRNNARLDHVVSSGLGSGVSMVNGIVNGINRNAIIAFGGSGKVYDQFMTTPFTPEATWTGADKIDTSKQGLIDRAQEYALEQALIANGMDADLAKTVASTTNGKIKAKKAKKEERTKAIESTAQTAIAVASIVATGGAAAPALGTVLTGGASATFYAVQGANIALQAAIGSRKGGAEGALAGAMNGVLQAVAATNFGKLAEGADKLQGMADEIQTMAMNNPLLVKTLSATNISYSKDDGWGVKANATSALQAVGVSLGANSKLMERFTNVTIGQSQRGGATLNLGYNTGSGNLGLTYTGATGDWEGSFDLMERNFNGIEMSSEISIGKDGLTVSGEMDFGNGFGLGIENGRSGVSSSLTILGSQQGSVDRYGNYTPNENFLGEINGQDIANLIKSQQDRLNSADAENPNDPDKKKDEGPSGLVDLAFATGALLMSGAAAWAAGGGSSVPSGSGGGSGAGNGGNSVVGRRREDEDNANEPPKKQPSQAELDNFKDNVFLNTTRAATDDYLAKLDAQGVDTKEMRAHAEAQRASGVRDLTAGEIKVKRLNQELNDLKIELDKASTIAQDNGTLSDANNDPIQDIAKRREEIKKKIADKEKEINQTKGGKLTAEDFGIINSSANIFGNPLDINKAINDDRNRQAKDLNQSFQTNTDNLAKSRDALNEATRLGENSDNQDNRSPWDGYILRKGSGGDSKTWDMLTRIGKLFHDFPSDKDFVKTKDNLVRLNNGENSQAEHDRHLNNTQANKPLEYTSIQARSDYYLWVDSQLEGKSKWFEAAAIVTKNNSVGAADSINLGFLRDSDDGFLRAGNKYLFDYNMQTAKALMAGNGKLTGSFKDADSKTVSFDGLTGKDLDYALVLYEQTKVQNFIDDYKRNNPNADINSSIESASKSITLPLAPKLVTEVIRENFSESNPYDFGNYQHRVILGQRLIDKLYKGKK